MIIYTAKITDDKNAALEAILKAQGERTGKAVTLDRLSTGKPVVLYNGVCEGFVSVSHTCDLIIAVFSDMQVGADIERKDRKVSQKICADIVEWTKYEAYGKYLGCGITKKLLSSPLPEELIFSFEIDGYVLSLASEDKKVDIIKLTS